MTERSVFTSLVSEICLSEVDFVDKELEKLLTCGNRDISYSRSNWVYNRIDRAE